MIGLTAIFTTIDGFFKGIQFEAGLYRFFFFHVAVCRTNFQSNRHQVVKSLQVPPWPRRLFFWPSPRNDARLLPGQLDGCDEQRFLANKRIGALITPIRKVVLLVHPPCFFSSES